MYLSQMEYTCGWETFSTLPYQDLTAPAWGWGHNPQGPIEQLLMQELLDRHKRGERVAPLPRDIGDAQFLKDMTIAQDVVRQAFAGSLNMPRTIAMSDVIYQQGESFLCNFPSACRAIRFGDWQVAFDNFLLVKPPAPEWSDWRKQTRARCETAAGIILTGRFPDVMPKEWTRPC